MKKRKFIRDNSEKMAMINEIHYLRECVKSLEESRKRLFRENHELRKLLLIKTKQHPE